MGDWFRRRVVAPLLSLLRQGVTPEKLALSVALGAIVAVIPVLGVSTVLCALLALRLRLNMAAIQLVNYLLTPAQLLLIIPFLRFGEALAGAPKFRVTLESGLALISQGVVNAVRVLWDAIVHATLGWLVLAPFAAVALYVIFKSVFRRLAPRAPATPAPAA
ncbi:MAG TPA: DUF2062 domain-containing protein [Steroidobacteraceae bacterium]|nr:DUF2062 domain-containing protein [Steroidobacteraceae bacterium]